MRHLHLGLVCAGAALLAWWALVSVRVGFHPWDPLWDGPMFLGAIAGATAGSALLTEGLLRRSEWKRRYLIPLAGGAGAFLIVVGWCGIYEKWVVGWVFGAESAPEPSLVSLRYELGSWIFAGGVVGGSVGVARRFSGFFTHVGAGLAAGAVGAGVWHAAGYHAFDIGPMDLFVSSALASATFGGTFGLGAWGIPDELYAGWVRVVSRERHGRRIPINGATGGARERFVGHFPRGLDLFLPVEGGVNELHASVLVDDAGIYRARGLTVERTAVRRFLERIDLRYDPKRPAPLETRLASGDRVQLGDGTTVVEFLLLPREET